MWMIIQVARKVFWSSAFTWLFFVVDIARAYETGGGTSPTRSSSFSFPSPLKDIGGIDVLVGRLLNDIVLPLGASVAAIAIIYSGFLYVKAQGDTSKLKEAHEAIKWSIVGTAVILGAWVLAQLIKGTIDALRVGGA